jgi:uncharacterized phage-like protein YoqJ
MIVGVTGHRPDKIGGWDPLHPDVERVRTVLRNALIKLWPEQLITGMALGVDQWAAQAAIELGIPFVAALPCDDMEAPWPLPSQERFRNLLPKARQIVVVSPGPFKHWKLQRRNEWVVDNCERLLSVHDGSLGGTYNCLEYAAQVGRIVQPLTWMTDVVASDAQLVR